MKHLITFCLFSCYIIGMAQPTAKRNINQVLVQFNHDQTPQSLNLGEFGRSSEIKTNQLISKHMNIWLMDFNEQRTSVENMLTRLKENPAVANAQVNHIITNRKKPNDTEYSKQWQYHNTATAGDIGAEDAWEHTTGGVTTAGDTIVLAVIDDGFDLSHTDFGDNLWVNRHEIPGNNIDDDGNGYKDDVKGWNADNNNDNIGTGGGHGTPVAGICGAKGDNNKGVAGVNWNVKLMIIIGGGAEADAIKAYSYALENRKLYNKTKGEKGAFVVGTNASWGVDYGKAADAPLWCALYDTLGNHGILNAGATANNDVDVDTEGDLPTQCPSEYLISVTNQGEDGKKIQSSGSGVKSIDLGAPGQGTWTTAKGDKYGGFGGTSGATPHVTGAIGLIYSTPCMQFAVAAIEDPAGTALKVRKYILDGVVANTTMNGKTVTGGSLNVNNAILALLQDINCSVSVKENKQEFKAFLFPNPAGNSVLVKLFGIQSNDYSLIITDFIGRAVITEKGSLSNNLININLNNLKSGAYIINIQTPEGNITQKLIKD